MNWRKKENEFNTCTPAWFFCFPTFQAFNILKNISASDNSSPGDEFHFLLEASRRSNATCLQLFAKNTEAGPGELAASSIISRCLNGQGHISSSLCDAKFQELVRQLCLWRDIMARLHDESLRFVLSENAIISLASEIPTTEKDICSTISKADEDLQSPSPLVCCHLDDLIWMLRENRFQVLIEQHLGPTATCPLSVYNYALLSKTSSLGLNNHTPTMDRNGFKAKKKYGERFCKSPVYDNCKIYANDGRLLCYCDRKRLEWYLNRNRAKLVEDDPSSIICLSSNPKAVRKITLIRAYASAAVKETTTYCRGRVQRERSER